MKLRVHYLFLSLFFSVACLSNIAVSEQVPLGMWSWEQESFETVADRERMIAFCKKHNISHIIQHVSTQATGKGHQIKNAESLTQLIVLAKENGITVSALRGERSMFFARRFQARKTKLKLLLDFNRGLPAGHSLLGIQYDVEPYLTDQWKAGGEARRQVVEDYLACLDMIRKEMDESGTKLKLGVDVPFWWDKPEHTYRYGGKEQAFVHHIQDRVDSINIMSYRRKSKDVLRFAKDEFAYAKQAGRQKSVSVGLNFINAVGSEKVTTFFGHSVSVFRTTMEELQKELADSPSVDRIMLHDYKALSEYVK